VVVLTIGTSGTAVTEVEDPNQQLQGACPEGVGIRPDGNVVYVTNFGIGGDANEVFLIDTAVAFDEISATSIFVGTSPNSIAFTPDGRFAYVTNSGTDDVSVIDTAIHQTVDTVDNVGRAPQGIAIGVIQVPQP
jgi:YVTN family beta-propeller protein